MSDVALFDHACLARILEGSLNCGEKTLILLADSDIILFEATMNPHVQFEKVQIDSFCQKWKVTEFSVFGSAVRADFSEESDVDILVSFASDAGWSLFDWVDMVEELESVFKRKVDLVEKEALRNPFRRKNILEHKEVLYAAA